MSAASPRGPEELLADAELAFGGGDLERASSLLQQAIEAGAEGRLRAEIHNDLGVVANARGRLEEADTEFQNALAHEPEFVDAIRNLAELWSQGGDQQRALRWQRRLSELTEVTGHAAGEPPVSVEEMATPAMDGVAVVGNPLPTVTCVITAHNYENYVPLAIESVLNQTYPAELLDVVVTDDGSTDGTAAAVERAAAAHPGRVTLVRRDNGGLAAATASAIAAARGEYLGICDADDLWLPGKVAAQMAIFMRRPSVTLCYGDMQVIDGDGRVTSPSFLTECNVPVRRGWAFEDLARSNFTTNSTLMWRAGTVPSPVAESPYADYWIALHSAMKGEVWGVEEQLSQYRRHGRNMGFGSVGAAHVPVVQRAVRFRRLALLSEIGAALSLNTLVELTLELEVKAREILALSPWALVELARVTDAQRQESEEITQSLDAQEISTHEELLRGYARAMLIDPFNQHARDGLLAAASRPAEAAVTALAG